MFIGRIAGKSSLARRRWNVLLRRGKVFRSCGVSKTVWDPGFYKHLVPPGLKTFHPDGVNEARAALAAGERVRGIIRVSSSDLR